MITPRAVVFDLDGTLVDSLDDILDSFLAAFASVDLQPPDRAAARSLVGRPLEDMYEPFAPAALVPDLAAAYRVHYPLHFVDRTRPYPGVVEVLTALGDRGYLRVVATTKRSIMAKELVEAVGLGPLLDHVQGTDGFPHKPEPDVILRGLAAVNARGTWMVGDTASDLVAGRAAGLKTYGVTWGTHDASTLLGAAPDALEDSLTPLLAMLEAADG
ncbi:MAG TPA: HAD-IA family hydrolase [Trueperaceae bacterium]|nr:HAD-IA family hydrolase [Trueperaceae bacterium]